MTSITPEKMADIYANRLRGHSLRVVEELVKKYEKNPVTLQYWQRVHKTLKRKFGDDRR